MPPCVMIVGVASRGSGVVSITALGKLIESSASLVVRNVTAADEVVDTMQTSSHLFRTSLVSLLM